jgi:NitT/TauT family transport system substrate-binding protein
LQTSNRLRSLSIGCLKNVSVGFSTRAQGRIDPELALLVSQSSPRTPKVPMVGRSLPEARNGIRKSARPSNCFLQFRDACRGLRLASFEQSIACMVLLLITAICGCSSTESDPDSLGKSDDDKVVLILNWLPEAEHGGYYAGIVHGIFAKYNLDVEIRPGGQMVMVAPELATGRVQFGIGNGDDVLISRNEGTNMLALMAPLQNGPRCIMVRQDSGIKSFDQLKNITLQINSGRPYVPLLKKKGLLDDSVKIVPYNGGVAQLVAGPGFAQQAYSFSEPLLAENEGVQVRTLMMSEIGFNPYACCLVTTDEYAAENADIVRRMTAACIEGWKKYLTDPVDTNAYILSQNQLGMTDAALQYGVEKLQPLCRPPLGSAACSMTRERWQALYDQLIDIEMISADNVDVESAFTTEFLAN